MHKVGFLKLREDPLPHFLIPHDWHLKLGDEPDKPLFASLASELELNFYLRICGDDIRTEND